MPSQALYAKYSDSVLSQATVSLTSGTAADAFPLSQLYDGRPDKIFRATGTACTIRATFGGSKTIQGIALIHHNLHGLTLTLTNNGGMASQNIVVPTASEDGFPIHPWWDGRLVANNAATQWNLAITGAAANVGIGELLLIETLRTLPIRWGPTEGEDHPAIIHTTERGVKLKSSRSVRMRELSGAVLLESDRAEMASLRRGTLGQMRGFLLIPDSTKNDALMVAFQESKRVFSRRNPGFTDQSIAVEELSAGVVIA